MSSYYWGQPVRRSSASIECADLNQPDLNTPGRIQNIEASLDKNLPQFAQILSLLGSSGLVLGYEVENEDLLLRFTERAVEMDVPRNVFKLIMSVAANCRDRADVPDPDGINDKPDTLFFNVKYQGIAIILLQSDHPSTTDILLVDGDEMEYKRFVYHYPETSGATGDGLQSPQEGLIG